MTRTELAEIIDKSALTAFGGELSASQVDYAQGGFGDFATNLPFQLAKSLGKPPRDLAAELAKAIAHPAIAKAEAAGAGYVNITMTPSYWSDQLAQVCEGYGRDNSAGGKKVNVEFISANPTGPLTIGNARGGFIGDVLANVLTYAGHDVTREYYFNDAGSQIDKLLESVKMEAGIIPVTDERQYRGLHIESLAAKFGDKIKTFDDYKSKELITSDIITELIKPAIQAMGIDYDVWFNEKELLANGLFDETVSRLRERDLVFERDGAVWLKTGLLGDTREERVIIKSNGDPTYMAPDIAYHVDIFERRQFDISIVVLGPDHIAQFPSVYAAVKALFPDKDFQMADYQMMRIIKDGKEYKVSKRLGQFVTAQELVDAVTMPVGRFLTLMRSADSHMDFDLDLATEQSAKNPYYYVMYAYARANSILAKAAAKNLNPAESLSVPNAQEVALIRQMTKLPELVRDMAADYGVHRLTFYGLELAKLFQEYYETQRIIDLPATEAGEKLYLIQKFVMFMDSYWSLLGIEPLKRMDDSPS